VNSAHESEATLGWAPTSSAVLATSSAPSTKNAKFQIQNTAVT